MIFYAQDQGMLSNELAKDVHAKDKNNRWLRLADAMPWAAAIERVCNNSLNNRNNVADNKPASMVLGAMMIKHLVGLSDEETIMVIKENPKQ